MAQFSSENQPSKRGRTFKTKLLETIRQESLLSLSKDASDKKAERVFLAHVAKRAFDDKDPSSNALLRELLNKSYASIKAVMPDVEFDYNVGDSPVEQVNQIILAASKGQVPPDVAAIFIQSLKHASDIEANTELKERIERLEAIINGG